MASSLDTARWYRRAFDADYLKLYAHRDESEAGRAVDLLASALPADFGEPLLDLACGGGRHSAAMLARGWTVFGVDLSGELLLRAMIDLCGYAAARADMRRLPFASGTFGAVSNFFTSFGYFEDHEENLDAAREMARVLRPGGLLLWDHINPAWLRATFQPSSARRLPDGSRVAETRSLDEERRRVEKIIRLMPPEGSAPRRSAERLYHESVRFYEPAEARALFEEAGFGIEAAFGGYGAEVPFSEQASRQILLCRRRGNC